MIDWQQIAALAIVAVSAALLVRAQIVKRRRAKASPCGADCGCEALKSIEEARKAHS